MQKIYIADGLLSALSMATAADELSVAGAGLRARDDLLVQDFGRTGGENLSSQ